VLGTLDAHESATLSDLLACALDGTRAASPVERGRLSSTSSPVAEVEEEVRKQEDLPGGIVER
jgi:hypothetical protein